MLRFHFYPFFWHCCVTFFSILSAHTRQKGFQYYANIYLGCIVWYARRTDSKWADARIGGKNRNWMNRKEARTWIWIFEMAFGRPFNGCCLSLSHSKYFECLYFRATPARRILFHFYVFGSIKSGWQWALGASVQCKINITRFDRRPCVLNSIHRW